jgi:hypothetical protein
METEQYTLLHDQWITEESREEINNFLQSNKNKSTTYQSHWDGANPLISMRAYIKDKTKLRGLK